MLAVLALLFLLPCLARAEQDAAEITLTFENGVTNSFLATSLHKGRYTYGKTDSPADDHSNEIRPPDAAAYQWMLYNDGTRVTLTLNNADWQIDSPSGANVTLTGNAAIHFIGGNKLSNTASGGSSIVYTQKGAEDSLTLSFAQNASLTCVGKGEGQDDNTALRMYGDTDLSLVLSNADITANGSALENKSSRTLSLKLKGENRLCTAQAGALSPKNVLWSHGTLEISGAGGASLSCLGDLGIYTDGNLKLKDADVTSKTRAAYTEPNDGGAVCCGIDITLSGGRLSGESYNIEGAAVCGRIISAEKDSVLIGHSLNQSLDPELVRTGINASLIMNVQENARVTGTVLGHEGNVGVYAELVMIISGRAHVTGSAKMGAGAAAIAIGVAGRSTLLAQGGQYGIRSNMGVSPSAVAVAGGTLEAGGSVCAILTAPDRNVLDAQALDTYAKAGGYDAIVSDSRDGSSPVIGHSKYTPADSYQYVRIQPAPPVTGDQAHQTAWLAALALSMVGGAAMLLAARLINRRKPE